MRWFTSRWLGKTSIFNACSEFTSTKVELVRKMVTEMWKWRAAQYSTAGEDDGGTLTLRSGRRCPRSECKAALQGAFG